ncbi:zinc-dependent metalloprotease [Pseudobacteriovorax antillogorgiicola]|uniref:EcxA zinc-binding domain-containing protein n=1 Tax=Pseudobacteriovorax antillogorgiicola TaxID=1513793 RepID=A0A1Y6BJE2_9BACT|nr:zinc-dependent metalloprotease [Pseudobacteriovorax antillogorgiicola]TCS56330.1 uncharacterized protein DUF4953 [Pseudobacteriovorax antillogorgiicola]SMF06972.1 protein of unknown function [Pseudobacteriovorax antillogorgiicola]
MTKQFNNPLKKVLLVMLAIAVVPSCQKKRSPDFVQGDGENLYSISDYQGKSFTITTGANRFKGQTSKADVIEIIDGFDGINSLDAVEFSVSEGLFANIDLSDYYFYGKENADYTLSYSMTDSHVILSKVAAKEDIPSQELTYATKLANGSYSVPMMGLPVSLYTVEKVKDSRGKSTQQNATFSKDYLSESTHFKVSKDSIKYFDAPKKLDLLPASFFTGDDEWVYTKTLVGRAINSKSILGDTPSALKIKFARTKNSILGVDLNIAKEQEVLDPTKTIVALEIPVKWVDFALTKSGSNAQLEETMLDDDESGARFWEERAYGLVDFNNADRLGQSLTQDNKLEKLEIGNDYFSFTIYESTTGNTYKYSLKKDNRKLDGQRIFAADKRMFHIFYNRRNVINGNLYQQDADFEKLDFANRIYPEDGEIVFNITKNTPNDPIYLEAIQASVDAWDKAFTEAGTGIRVRLDDKRVDLGDVRYNQISFYGYEIDSSMNGGGMLLGFGPSVQDTRNGVTFSASTHIYLRAYREGIIRSVRSFVRNELGLYDDKAVKGIQLIDLADGILEGGALINSKIGFAESKESLFDVNDEDLFAPIAKAKVKPKDSTELQAAIPAFARTSFSDSGCGFAAVASSSNNWKKIRNECLKGNSSLDSYLKKLKEAHSNNSEVLNLEGEEEAILSCAQNLMKDTLISTLIHEIGHNLGLGHNFAASSDEPNFAKKEDKKTYAYPSSSVMDYPDRDFDLFSKAGPYDVAAIKYLYGRKVDLKDGTTVEIPANTSVADAAAQAGSSKDELKKYRMCTDSENNGNDPFFDPLCRKWDVGSKPQEYVTWAVSQIHAGIIQNGYVYNNKVFSGRVGVDTYFLAFRQIYEYWRYLIYNYPGVGRYLEGDKGTLEELQKIVDAEAANGNVEYKNYFEASKLIFNFLTDVLFQPLKVCQVYNEEDRASIVEFRKFRSNLFATRGVTVQNCKEAEKYLVEDYSELLGENLGVIEYGQSVQSLELDLDPDVLAEKLKEVYTYADYFSALNPVYSYGFEEIKNLAMVTLFRKSPNLQPNFNRGFYPSMMDSREYSQLIREKLLDRVINGLDGKTVGLTGGHLPFFKEEQGVYLTALSTFINRADRANSASRPIRRSFTATVKLNEKASGYAGDSGTLYRLDSNGMLNIATESRNPDLYKMMKRLNLLDQLFKGDIETVDIVMEKIEKNSGDLRVDFNRKRLEDFMSQLLREAVDTFAEEEIYFTPEQYNALLTMLDMGDDFDRTEEGAFDEVIANLKNKLVEFTENRFEISKLDILTKDELNSFMSVLGSSDLSAQYGLLYNLVEP